MNYPEEAKLLGEMVLGYGELDLAFTMTCGKAMRRQYALIHAVNQVRSETSRLDVANAMSVGVFAELGLTKEYARILRAMRFCLRVRNQWAHSQWADLGKRGLAFSRADDDVFAMPLKPVIWTPITLPLLQKQEAFFEYTRLMLLTVESNLVPILAGKPPKLPMPPEKHEPSMHSQWPRRDRARTEPEPKPQP